MNLRLLWIVCGFAVVAVAILWWLTDDVRGIAWARSVVKKRFPDQDLLMPEAYAAALEREQEPQLLDVRTADEYEVSHLPGAQRVDVDGDSCGAGLDASRPVYVYCAGGYRAAQYAERLKAAGFPRVVNLSGGIFAWANEGRLIVNKGRPAKRVHSGSSWFQRLLKPSLR
jgi:rhodanese-related sulfurtransferase